MMIKRRGTVLLSLALSLGAVGCKKPAPAPTPDPTGPAADTSTKEAPIPVRFAKVESRKLPRGLETSGTLDADERSEVAAQSPGVVLKVLVDVGARVKSGETLVELDGREASLRLASANAQTAQQLARLGMKAGTKFDPEAVPDVRAAREARDFAVAEAERAKAIFQSGGLPQSAFDQAKSAAERARAQYEAAQNGAEQAWAALLASQAQGRLAAKSADDMRVKAPFAGAVVEKRVAPGEFAQAGRVVAVLVRDNPLRLRIDVPESDVSGIVLGQPVDVTVAAYPGKTFRGEIKRIGASVKVQSRTLPIEADVPNDDGALRPGFFARARIALTGEPVEALMVPKAAVGSSGGSSRVFVRAGDRVTERLVTTGRESGELVEVRGPLAVSDEVAVTSVDQLSDSALVAAQP